MSATSVPTVGVAGAPEVAAALREIGYTVVTGKTFRDAAIAIASQLKLSKVHVVVESMAEPGFTPWVKATHGKSLGVILLPTDPSVDLAGVAGIPQLELPAQVNDLLVLMQVAPAMASAGQAPIIARGAVAAPALAPAPVPAPAQVDPFAALPVPAAPVHSDPFEVLVTPADPTVPAATDPFDLTAPYPPAQAGPDAFEAMLSAAATTTTTPEPTPAPAPEPVPFGVPNPVVERAEVIEHDPYLAADATGDENSFLASMPAVVEPEATPAPAPINGGYTSRRLARQERHVQPDETAAWAPSPAPVPTDVPVPVQTPVSAPLPAYVPEPTPIAPEPWAATPAPATFRSAPVPEVDFFSGSGISAGGCQVVISIAGKGGAGKTTQSLLYGQTAGGAGLRVLVIDANRDQGDIGTSLRIERAGFPSILAAVNGHPADAIVAKDRINAARPSASQDITFDVVLAPPREFAGPQYASAAVYAKLLAYAKSKYELVVIDTQIVEAQKSDLHLGFVIPELRSGAWSAGIALYDYSAIRNAFSVFDELAALGVTPQRTLVVATRWPERESDADRFNSQFGHFGTFLGFIADDPNVNAQKSVGNLLVGSPAVAPVVRALLHRVTGRDVFAPIEETGKKRRKSTPSDGAKRERRGLFGGRR